MVITSVPIVTSVAITFGILGITDMVLTPQVVLIAPVLIALGVAYGLYIANRYSDERDIEDREERIRKAVKTTGKAIFLSAVTTSIGFASLMTVQMIPLQVLGFGLSIGILLCYVTTILTVPSLVMLLDYRKKGEIKSREKIGNINYICNIDTFGSCQHGLCENGASGRAGDPENARVRRKVRRRRFWADFSHR